MRCMPRKASCVRCLDKAATLNTSRPPLRPNLLSCISTYKLLNSKANTHLNNRNTLSSQNQGQVVQKILCDKIRMFLILMKGKSHMGLDIWMKTYLKKTLHFLKPFMKGYLLLTLMVGIASAISE